MPKISLFKNVFSIELPEDDDLVSHLEKIRDGEWQDIVLKCRSISDPEQRKKFKANMPTATLSGSFERRRDDALIEHSGYMNIDLDNVENLNSVKSKLEDDKYVFSVFTSTSGYGLRVIFKINPAKHKESFDGITEYLFERYNIVSDPNGSNISKPYIVSFDPFLYINPNTVPVFTKYIKPTPIKKLKSFVHTEDDFNNVLSQIRGRHLNICESYQDWLKVGFSIAEKFGENGRDYFHSVSMFSDKYDEKVTNRQYNYCIKGKGSEKANISSFYYLAKIQGINITSERTKTIVRSTRNGKRAGLSKQQIVDNLSKFSEISGSSDIVDQVFDTDDDVDEELSTLHQLEMYISHNYQLKMNEVTGYFEQNDRSLSESDLNSIFISAKKLIPTLDYNLMMRLLKSDFIEAYNPFFKFFGSDGIPVQLPSNPDLVQKIVSSPLIDKLASCIDNDDPSYTLFFLRKWLVSVVSAAHKVHSPLLCALLGPQNTGKTEFFRRLFPKELQPYYAESKLDKEKDDELLMCENLVIMDDELGGKSKQDAQKLKNITSKQWFSLRRPYGDHNEKILRLAVLCGTSNYMEILTDPTGNRRIIPIEVPRDIKKELYNSINKKDLWMEVYRLYKEGFDWRVTHIDIPYLNNNKEEYQMVCKEKELIEKFYEPSSETAHSLSYSDARALGIYIMSTTEILVELELLTKQHLSINIIGRELKELGFFKKCIRIADRNPSKWFVEKINRESEGAFGLTNF